MAKITRYTGNLEPFASNSASAERTIFGDTTTSDTLDGNINADFLTGWEIVGANDAPPSQWFNALGYTTTKLLSYLHQMGVAEWDSAQTYYVGSVVVYDGDIYQSKTADNTGNIPSSSTANWKVAGLGEQAVINNTTASDPHIILQRSGTTVSRVNGTTFDITDSYQTIAALSGYTHGIFLIIVAGKDNGQPVAAWMATRTSSTGTAIITALQSQNGTGLWVGKSLQLQWTGAGAAPQIKHDRAGNTLSDARIHTINLARI